MARLEAAPFQGRLSHLKGFFWIGLSHWNVGIFRTIRRLLYRRRRRLGQLAQVELHNS
jgi:hypothetical protein